MVNIILQTIIGMYIPFIVGLLFIGIALLTIYIIVKYNLLFVKKIEKLRGVK